MDAQRLGEGRGWRVDLRVAATWAVLSALSAMALVPYLRQLMPEKFEALPMSLPALVLLQGLQALLLLGAMALLGLRMGHRVGLGSPLLARLWGAHSSPTQGGLRRALQAIAIGIAAALLIMVLSNVIDPLLPPMRHPPATPTAGHAALNGLLASFYGGIAEEVQLRLFLMTLLVWCVARLRKGTPPDSVYWASIVAAALLFGVGHLPAAQQVWGTDAIVLVRTVLLNAVAGLAFGWLYWRRGLEMAVLGHFSADIVLHVVPPLLGMGTLA